MDRNSFTFVDFAALLETLGQARVAYLVGKYPDVVQPFLPKIYDKLKAKGLITSSFKPVALSYQKKGFSKHGQGSGGEFESPAAGFDRARAARPLTDREGWTMLADLVDTALSDQPAALRESLKGAFRAEAAKAA